MKDQMNREASCCSFYISGNLFYWEYQCRNTIVLMIHCWLSFDNCWPCNRFYDFEMCLVCLSPVFSNYHDRKMRDYRLCGYEITGNFYKTYCQYCFTFLNWHDYRYYGRSFTLKYFIFGLNDEFSFYVFYLHKWIQKCFYLDQGKWRMSIFCSQRIRFGELYDLNWLSNKTCLIRFIWGEISLIRCILPLGNKYFWKWRGIFGFGVVFDWGRSTVMIDDTLPSGGLISSNLVALSLMS